MSFLPVPGLVANAKANKELGIGTGAQSICPLPAWEPPYARVHFHAGPGNAPCDRLHAAGLQPQTERRFPVLYLLHGSGDTEASRTAAGRAEAVMDDLLAAARAKPMIVVMPNGHITPPEAPEPKPSEFRRLFSSRRWACSAAAFSTRFGTSTAARTHPLCLTQTAPLLLRRMPSQ